MALASKTRLGTYEILGPLGSGGMGEVYRAKDLRLRREVAVKVLSGDLAPSPERLARFEREARIVAGLNHPNIVTLFSVEEEEGVRFLTMELIEGQNLADLITPGGLSVSRVLELSIPLADALVAAHEKGVVHRDLKPANVMATREGRVKVLDFGLAKLYASDDRSEQETPTTITGGAVSRYGEVLGTVPYMAPEQIRGEPVDARSDLFALGIILYELATGRRPFTGATAADVGSSILRDTPEPMTRLRAGIPVDLDRIAGRCLEKNPRDRFQTALDVYNELRRVKQMMERGGGQVSQGVASIAVLPFVNRSRAEEDEYFSDGLADELLSTLAKVRGLRVAARTSSFSFKGKNPTIAEVGRALNVAAVLEGSVRKAGNRVRISVQLVKVSGGYHLWSETYDRTLEDIFVVQDDIAQSIVTELRTALLGEAAGSSGDVIADVAKAVRGRGSNAEAHRLYLQGRHYLGRYEREEVANGIRCLRQALELEPGHALAWASLGGAYSIEADWGWVPAAEGYERSRESVERALSLEPDVAEGHAQLGWIRMVYDWDWRGADASYRRAVELAPGNASVLLGAGSLAYNVGRLQEAIELYGRAVEQDPLSSGSLNNLGRALHAADRFAEAEEAYRRGLELAPQRVGTHADLALTLLAEGRGEQALAEAMQEPLEWARLRSLAMVRHAMGKRTESDEALRKLIEIDSEGGAYQIAEVHAKRGEPDAAFGWLERAYAQRDPGLAEMKTNPHFRSLQNDPRWATFLNRMGFAN